MDDEVNITAAGNDNIHDVSSHRNEAMLHTAFIVLAMAAMTKAPKNSTRSNSTRSRSKKNFVQDYRLYVQVLEYVLECIEYSYSSTSS
jgi:hypothetical protein